VTDLEGYAGSFLPSKGTLPKTEHLTRHTPLKGPLPLITATVMAKLPAHEP
jgi:hypothetical protein